MLGTMLRAAPMAAVLALGACSVPPTSDVWLPVSDNPSPVRLSLDRVGAGAAQAATPARIAVTHAFMLRMPSTDVEASR